MMLLGCASGNGEMRDPAADAVVLGKGGSERDVEGVDRVEMPESGARLPLSVLIRSP